MNEDNTHTRVSTGGGSGEEGRPVKARLYIEKRMGRPVEGEMINLLFGAQMLIGRDKTSDIHLPDDRISRKHALLRIDNDAVRLAELGSTNGSTRNQESFTDEIILESGDVVEFGRAKAFEVRVVEKEGIITSARLASGADAYLLVPQEFIIGSGGEDDREADLKIYDPDMLPAHARIEYFAGRTFVVSLDQQKPVIVNGNPVREMEIRNNYLIEAGNSRFRYERTD